MALFSYKARRKDDHKTVTGTLEAIDKNQAIKQLRAKGLLILSIEISHGLNIAIPGLNKVSGKDRILFARQFAVMMRAGLPILDALRSIAEQTTNKSFRTILHSMTKQIEGGTSLSDAFDQFPAAFPPIFVSVARIGEKSGKLEEVLERLATQLESDDELVSKIRGAMIYPIFVMSALVIVIFIILIYIIPQLKGLFEDAAVDLPFITRALLAISAFASKYVIWIVGAVIIGLGGTRYASHKYPIVRYRIERFRIHIPVFGRLYKQMIMARFCHTLATLLAAGLPMIEAIKTTANVLNSPSYFKSLHEMTKHIESGQTLSRELLNNKDFPNMIGSMVAIGEKSGKIDQTLETVAGFFDKDIESLTRNLSALLEPFLMIVMGLGVGLVVASVIVPIYDLVNAV